MSSGLWAPLACERATGRAEWPPYHATKSRGRPDASFFVISPRRLGVRIGSMPAATLPAGQKQLIVLGCSAVKRKSESVLPAISLYDGPTFPACCCFLREFHWPRASRWRCFRRSTGSSAAFPPSSLRPADDPRTRRRAERCDFHDAKKLERLPTSGSTCCWVGITCAG